jgi:hypothetical protein
LFLFLEYGDVILMDRIVSLVREDGRTKILLDDNSAAESGFTPQALEGRNGRLFGGQNAKKSLEGGWKGKH